MRSGFLEQSIDQIGTSMSNNSPCKAASQDSSDSDLLSSEIGIQRKKQRIHSSGSDDDSPASSRYHRGRRRTRSKKPKSITMSSQRFRSMSESEDEDDLGSFQSIEAVTFDPDFDFLNSDLKQQSQLVKEAFSLEERHLEKVLVTPEGPNIFYPGKITPPIVSLALAVPSSPHKVLYKGLSSTGTSWDETLDCLNSGLIQMWLIRKQLAPEAWLHQWLLELAAFHPCMIVSEGAAHVLVDLIEDKRHGSMHVLPVNFLTEFHHVAGASWLIDGGVFSSSAAAKAKRTMPLPGELANSIFYTNMGPVMRVLTAYLKAGRHGLDKRGLVDLVVKLAYSTIDTGVQMSCRMAMNCVLSEAISAFDECMWEEGSSDGMAHEIIIQMLLDPSALGLSKEKDVFLFIGLVRGLPHTARGGLLRRGLCHKVLLKLLKGSTYEIKTEGLHSIIEAGHLQALLVFEVLLNCEVGLAEDSDEAGIRVYTAIAMAQQLIYADPPSKRIQYKRLQEAISRIPGRLLKSHLKDIVSRSRQLLELVTAELRAGVGMI